MRFAALFVLAVLLSGCVDTLQARITYMNQFVGRPETDLVMAMGVPTRSFESGGFRFLAYDEQRIDVFAPSPYWGGFWGYGYGGFPAQVVTWSCETTVAVKDNIVQSFSVRGNGC